MRSLSTWWCDVSGGATTTTEALQVVRPSLTAPANRFLTAPEKAIFSNLGFPDAPSKPRHTGTRIARESHPKSRALHASTPKVANPSIATETAQSSARFVSIIALSTLPCVPGPRSHGPPRSGARWACRPHVPIAFRCFKTASPQRLANARDLGSAYNLWRVRALAVPNSIWARQTNSVELCRPSRLNCPAHNPEHITYKGMLYICPPEGASQSAGGAEAGLAGGRLWRM